ncbi:branched-chain amino acid ABC transporter ATP-binding protein/permease [Ramlibacter sp. G-1-2-2]|uniref:Branched-chain amino acid ABC transporter ATP-binding protein/permease n=1 Tax=Ramlibacter agri TaxID=2728837 RepID=A0A848HCP9_9BURK|nr:branched-chain amino acid ABC transporter ATP-binding protein/permease [Ramlibacter agri]NML47259.1 branched-chain amino acid ABC transporter ATP-binding protein/permease [Ramlibacter agri]
MDSLSPDPAALPRLKLPSLTVLVCGIAVLVSLGLAMSSSYFLLLLTFAAIYLLAAMGLNVLSGYAGIVSIAHGAMVCVGAYATAIATVRYGWNFWPAAGLSVLVGMGFSALLALPALRLSSWYFVLITIAFTLAVTAMLNDLRSFTGGYGGIVGVPMPTIFGAKLEGRGLFLLVVGLVAVVAWAQSRMMNSRIGWALHSIRAGAVRAQANGVSIHRMRLFAFVFAGALAGLAGAFYASAKVVVTPEDFSFDFSIFFLFVVVLGGPARLAGPLLGVLTFYVLPELLGSLKEYRMIVYGIGLLLFSVFLPEGLAGLLAALDQRFMRRGAAALRADAAAAAAAKSPPERQRVSGAALSVRGVVKNFGGVRALDDVSLEVKPGSIHAIVGPNGSGKTTLLNMISGFYPSDAGSMKLGDSELAGRSATAVARQGVQRTFQTPKLLPGLSVLENTRFGGYARERASGAEIALGLPRATRESAALDAQAMHLLSVVGMEKRAGEEAALLPHGQQRLVEIARAMLGEPRLLLLDEPAAGLSLGELEEFGALLKEMRRLGMTIVMVEHHIELVADLADAVTVLDQGKVLAEGTPEEVFRSAAVVSAYTGAKK